MSCAQQISSGGGSTFCKNNLGMCVRPLYVLGNLEFGNSVMLQNYSLNCYQFPSPTAILCFYIFTFPSLSSALRVGRASTVNSPRAQGATCARSLATGLCSSWEGHGLGSGSYLFIKWQKPCPEQRTPATMKGPLLLLALLVTRELNFEMREGRKEGPDGPPDPCPLLSHCILPSLVQATSRGRFWGQLSDQCPGVLHKLLEAFSLWMEGVVWGWKGH